MLVVNQKGGFFLHFIDWRYKGLRVRTWHKHLIWRVLSICFLFVFFSFFVYQSWSKQYFAILTAIPFTSLLHTVFLSVFYGLASDLLLFVLLFPLFKRFLVLQRICNMVYSSRFYMVNDFEAPNMMKSNQKRMKKDIIYFPRFYAKLKGEQVLITVRLDGSQFHQSGKLKELSGIFEDLFSIDLVGMGQKNGYFTYTFEAENIKNRLSITDVVPQNYTIPLMKGIYWAIAKVPHALISGGTGGGKSYFLFILLRAFILMKADIRIGDPKNSDLADMAKYMPHVYSDPKEITTMVDNAVIEMNHRYSELKKRQDYKAGQDFTYYDLTPLVIVIDEYVAWLTSISAKKDRDAVLNSLRQIILKGRQVGVIGIFATQRPDAQFLVGDIRDQLGLRITLGEMSDDGYKMAFGKTGQTLINKAIKGRGYIQLTGSFMIREFFSPLVPKGFDFIEELGKLLVDEPNAFGAKRTNASSSLSDQQNEPSGDYEVREIIFEEKNSYERSE